MAPVKSSEAICKVCGYNPAEAPSAARYLKPGTIINERFMAGCVISENPFSVTYIGMDLAEKKKKIIKEYCPFSCATRVNNEFEENTLNITKGKEEIFNKGLSEFISYAKKIRELEADEVGGLEGIMRVTNVIEAKGTCYVLTDYAEGTTLKKLLKTEKPDSKKVFALMKPIINSLISLHKNDIIHGNISPFNIIISPDMAKATLVGFGLTKTAEEYPEFNVLPKGGYTPLEQYTAFKGAVGPWTDIYSVCATIYNALTGVTPPDAPDRTVNDALDSLSDHGVTVSETKQDALFQGLSVYERDRFKAIRALYNAMYSEDEEVVYAEEPVQPEEPPAAEEKPASAPEKEEAKPEPKPVEPVKAEEPDPAAEPDKPVAELEKPAKPDKPAPAAATANPSGGYSQVIVRRRDKENIEINGTRYSAKLDKLDLSCTGLTDDDTAPIELMENLEYLYIDDNKIADIEFVNRTRKLVALSAKKNYITDISALVNLSMLRELYLGGNRELSDVSVLEYLRGIRKLDLSDTAVTDVRPIIYLDHLKYLDLRGTDVTQRQIKMLYSEMPNCEIKYDIKK